MVKKILGTLTAFIIAGSAMTAMPIQTVQASGVDTHGSPLYEVSEADNTLIGSETFMNSFVSDNVAYPYTLNIEVMADSTAVLRFDVSRSVVEQLHDYSDFGLFTFSARQFYEENFDGNEYEFSYAGGSFVYEVGDFNKVDYDIYNPDAEIDPYLLKLNCYTLLSVVDTDPNELAEVLPATEDTEFMLRITPTYDDTKLSEAGDYYQLHVGGKTYEVQCKADEDGKLYAEIIEVEDTGAFDFSALTAPHLVELGDANGDGDVDIMDVIAVNKALLGSASITDDMLTAVDFDRNGLDTNDSLNLIKYVVEMVDKAYLSNMRAESLS